MKLKITTRIAISSTVMMLLIVALGISGYIGIVSLHNQLESIEKTSSDLDKTARLNFFLGNSIRHLDGYVITGGPSYKKEFDETLMEFEKALRGFEGGDKKERRILISEIELMHRNIKRTGQKILGIEDPINSKEALELLGKVRTMADRMLYSIHTYYIESSHYIESSFENARDVRRHIDISQIIGAVVALITGVSLILYNTKKIIRPIIKLRKGALKIASGDLSYKFDIRDGEELTQLSNAINDMSRTILADANELDELFRGTVKALSSAVDAKSPWTSGHSGRVTSYAMAVGAGMGFSSSDMKALELAATLHDIGKIGTYESILNKAGKLSEEEFEVMKQHPAKGAEIISHIKHLEEVAPIIRGHHESFNGTGYPDGLKEEEIPLLSRVITVCDTYDAMTSDRPYRQKKTQKEALKELRRCSGTQFDPSVVAAFMEAICSDYQI